MGATNRGEASLKHDLLARLKLRIAVPGLDERREDVPLLARGLLMRLAGDAPALRERFFDAGEARVDPELVEALLTHEFTTHHRELESLLLVAMATSTGAFVALTPAVRERIHCARRGDPDSHPNSAVCELLGMREHAGKKPNVVGVCGAGRAPPPDLHCEKCTQPRNAGPAPSQ